MPNRKDQRTTRQFVDPSGVTWTVRAERRRNAVLSLDGGEPSIAWSLVLVFTSELGDVRRGVDPVTEQWVEMSPAELSAYFARTQRVGHGPGSVRP